MHDLVQEIRLAVRQLARRPWLTFAAVVSLALGIGANSAIFSLVNAVLLRGVPAARPAELVEIYTGDKDEPAYSPHAYPDFLDLRQQRDVFSDAMAYRVTFSSSEVGERTQLVLGEAVSANFLDFLGLPPALGRGFVAEEDVRGGAPVAVIGWGYWQRRFGADPAVIGRTIRLSGTDFTIIGVAPESLKAVFPLLVADFWVPMAAHERLGLDDFLDRRNSRSLSVKARLTPGVTLEQANARLSTFGKQLAVAYPESNENRTFHAVPASRVALNPAVDRSLMFVATVLMALVFAVLLIACSNIANLLLARAADRQREVAVRLAMGSGRWRLMRQLLVESLLLALGGGILGTMLAFWLAGAITRFQPPLPVPISMHLEPDGRVVAFTFTVSLLTGLLCGLMPALRASRLQLVPSLKSDTAAVSLRGRRINLRNGLIVAQVAMSTLLLLGAGLFLRSLGQAQAIDPGFALRRGAIADLALGIGGRYTPEAGAAFYRQLLERVRALPSVQSAALADHLPLSLNVRTTEVGAEGQEPADWDEAFEIDVATVGQGYFETMGIPILQGQELADQTGEHAVVLNQTAATKFWPGESAIGKRVRFGADEPWHTVVGVAADGRYRTLGEATRPFAYTSWAGERELFMSIVAAARPGIDERGLLAQLRAEIDTLDRGAPVMGTRTMTEHLALMLFPARMGAALLSAFGMLGLVLACVGLYGVVAYTVARRTREVGIRMAIGASSQDVQRLVVGGGMKLVGVGIALGVLLGLVAMPPLKSLLFGIVPLDPLTFAGVSAVLAAVALVANWLPARRASRIAPVEALRQD